MVLLSREVCRTSLFVILFALSLFLSSCESKTDMTMLETLAAMNQPMYLGKPVSSETVGEIKKLVSRYERDVQARIAEKEQIGVLYKNVALKYLEIDGLMQTIAEKILGQSSVGPADGWPSDPRPAEAAMRRGDGMQENLYHEALALGYIDKGIYGEALRYLEMALEVYPDNELLYYYSGLCSAKMGKAMIGDADKQESWFMLAEQYYRRAIELYPGFSQALYGLSILFVFELARPSEAEPILVKLTTIESQNTDALFLLANVYYRLGRYDAAIQQYETIERVSKISERVKKAGENKKRIMDERYGE